MSKQPNSIINKFFEGNNNEYKSGEWNIHNGGYDLIAEICYGRTPVCGIINDIGGYEIRRLQNSTNAYEAVKATFNVLKEKGINITNYDDVNTFLKENKPKTKAVER